MDPAELTHRFQFHPADAQNTSEDHQQVVNACSNAAFIVDAIIPDGREKSIVMTKLEEAAMWASAALDRADGPRS